MLPPPSLDEILRAEPRAIELLAASDKETWNLLTSNMDVAPVCPAALTRALLAIDDPDGWSERGKRAFNGMHPEYAMGVWVFRNWFGAGLVEHLPRDAAALAVRYEREREYVETDAAERLIVLTDEIEECGDFAKHQSVLGRTLVLLARRLFEDGDHEGARAAAQRADDIFVKLGDAGWRAQAMGVRAAALLRQRKVDDALALHDQLSAQGEYWYAVHITPRADDGLVADPLDSALAAAAKVVLGGFPKDHRNWLDVLEPLARHVPHPGCAERLVTGRRLLAEREEAEAARQEAARQEARLRAERAAARPPPAPPNAPDDDEVPGPYR